MKQFLHLDDGYDDVLNESDITVWLAKDVNMVYSLMPSAEQKDLANRWHVYWMAKRLLPGALQLSESGEWRELANDNNIPLNVEYDYLLDYIAGMRNAGKDFEAYIGDCIKVFA